MIYIFFIEIWDPKFENVEIYYLENQIHVILKFGQNSKCFYNFFMNSRSAWKVKFPVYSYAVIDDFHDTLTKIDSKLLNFENEVL
jgi:hypothetical protein